MLIHRLPVPLLLLLVATSAATESIVVRTDRPLAATEAAGERFPATARFLPDGSGTLVAPNWILTAAHVARGLSPFGQEVEVAGRRVVIGRVIIHPKGEDLGEYYPEVDVALVQLREPIADVTPVRPYTKQDEVGRLVTLAGYGDFGHADDAELASQNGVCRAVTNRVDHLFQYYLALTFDEGEDATDLEGVSGPGDSGGPLYIENGDEIFVAGISGFTTGGVGKYGGVDHYARVSVVADWIEETIARPSPAIAPEILDLRKVSLPDTVRGELARQLVEAFNEGPEAFRAFAESQRESAYWARLGGRREMYGEFTALRYLDVDKGHCALLVSLGTMGGYRVVNLWFDAEGTRLRNVSLGVAKVSAETDD